MVDTDDNALGAYLKDRRAKLDPAAYGFSPERRRTPGLRREEVAQRANVSATWYTWLEQGRGGAPSADVLDRIARALRLSDIEREHLFLIGLGRPPGAHYRPPEGVTPRVQRVLDALEPCPALIRTATWHVVAWNLAASAMLIDYGSLPPEHRNVLRFIFLDPRARAAQPDWEGVARGSSSARSGPTPSVPALPPPSRRWSPNCPHSVPISGGCGRRITCAVPPKPSSTYAIPCSAIWRSNIRRSRSMAGRT